MSGKTISSEITNVEVLCNNCGCNPDPDPEQVLCVGLDSTELNNCKNTPLRPVGRRDGLVAKIPVVLAELRVRVNLNSRITLPEPTLEVKDIKKRLKITQCLILPDFGLDSDVLFIEGFIRKNIEYATRTCSNANGVCGDIRHCTIDTPFRCSTNISNYCRFPEGPSTNFREEFEYLRRETLPRETFAEKDRLLSGDFSEFNQHSHEFFNELPFCDLIESHIVGFDEFINRTRPVDVTLPFEEREFTEIQEKMAIAITLKILQNQQVVVPPTTTQPCPTPCLSCSNNLVETELKDNGEDKEEDCKE